MPHFPGRGPHAQTVLPGHQPGAGGARRDRREGASAPSAGGKGRHAPASAATRGGVGGRMPPCPGGVKGRMECLPCKGFEDRAPAWIRRVALLSGTRCMASFTGGGHDAGRIAATRETSRNGMSGGRKEDQGEAGADGAGPVDDPEDRGGPGAPLAGCSSTSSPKRRPSPPGATGRQDRTPVTGSGSSTGRSPIPPAASWLSMQIQN